MKCKNLKHYAEDYINKTLSSEEMKEMEKHLNDCTQCTNETDEIKSLKTILASLDKKAPEPGFEAAVMQKIKNKKFVPNIFEAFLSAAKTSFLAAVLLLGIIATFSYFTPSVAVECDNIDAMNHYVLKDNIFAEREVNEYLLG